MPTLRFILLAVLVLASLSPEAPAQTSGKIYRIGFLSITSGPGPTTLRDGLSRELAQHGFVPDQNLVIETRSADAKPERLPGLAKELVASGVDLIVTFSYPASRAAKEATATVPIVASNGGDPVETGLAASLSRPGGNLTGISDMASELSP